MKVVYLIAALASLASCGPNNAENTSELEAYNAGRNERHIVIAAPLGSSTDQRLWVCRGNNVEEGTNPYGYKVSIGIGKGRYRDLDNQTTYTRGRPGSNLTPVGELRISRKIPSTCGRGMVTRCMQLDGVEQGINDKTIRRQIYIHGTPTGNYQYLGDSASHGCVRMKQTDVKTVYNNVSVGTRVYINSKSVPRGNPCAFDGAEDGYAAR